MEHRISRSLAALGVTGALVAGAPAAASVPAPPAELSVFVSDTTIAIGSAGKLERSILAASKPVVLQQATMRYDASALAGTVELASDDADCTSQSPAVLVCTQDVEIELGPDAVAGHFNAVVKATADAVAGASGVMTATFGAAGFASVTHQSKIRVGDGVDLAAGRPVRVSVKPGARFTAPTRVRNTGKTIVDGAVVVFGNDYAFRAGATRPSNCLYHEGRLRACAFDTDLAPRTTYTAAVPYTLGKDTEAPGGAAGQYQWLTPAEYEDFAAYLRHRGLPLGTPGIGAPLTLRTVTAAAAKPQSDTDPDNNWGLVEVRATGRNSADLAAIGASVTGAAGAAVPVTVGLVNKGPATIDFGRSGEPITNVVVTPPTGTTIVAAPSGCSAQSGGAYRCKSGVFLQAGKPQTFQFSLRIDRVVPNATGTVVVNGGDSPVFRRDRNPANNKAQIVANATGGTGGGGLPVTGSALGTPLALGALLLAAGVTALAIGRRRQPAIGS